MKEKFKELINYIRVVPYIEYRELKGEWEKQNIKLDENKAERHKLLKEIKKLTDEKFELKANYETEKQQLQKDIEDLKNELELEKNKTKNLGNDLKILANKNKKLEKDLEEKEKQRHSSASKIGGYVTEINRLNAINDFLKKHRRAPSIEELKAYTERTKTVCKKN